MAHLRPLRRGQRPQPAGVPPHAFLVPQRSLRNGRTMGLVAEEGLLGGGRRWFVDTRSPARRLGVSSHPEDGVVVLSLWQGDRCTGTFRLPFDDAALLVAA